MFCFHIDPDLSNLLCLTACVNRPLLSVTVFVNRPYIIVENGRPKVAARHLEELTQGYRYVLACVQVSRRHFALYKFTYLLHFYLLVFVRVCVHVLVGY